MLLRLCILLRALFVVILVDLVKFSLGSVCWFVLSLIIVPTTMFLLVSSNLDPLNLCFVDGCVFAIDLYFVVEELALYATSWSFLSLVTDEGTCVHFGLFVFLHLFII